MSKRRAEQIAEKSIPFKARSETARSIPNCDAAVSEKQIPRRSRDFTFSHSQGQKATIGWSAPLEPDRLKLVI